MQPGAPVLHDEVSGFYPTAPNNTPSSRQIVVRPLGRQIEIEFPGEEWEKEKVGELDGDNTVLTPLPHGYDITSTGGECPRGKEAKPHGWSGLSG